MPGVRGYYRPESESHGIYGDGRPFIDLVFVLSGEQPAGDFPPFTVSERFTDLEHARELATCGERIGIMITQWLGQTAPSIIARESELPEVIGE